MDFIFPGEFGSIRANTETLPDASDDEFQMEPLRISLVQFPQHLLTGLQEIVATYRARVQFEQPEWSQPNSTLATMRMDADTMIYPMTMDTKFKTDTEMAPAAPTTHALWRVAFRHDSSLGSGLVCRCNNFANERGKEIILAYGQIVQAFRGLGRLMTAAEAAARPNFNAES
ncbi:hypothetical protein BDF19DRAFT_435497 [Syncephalis fuscata]|nr:hypothetical protein BDF19DRAFT_435497 [Syncephalis fuscata]